MVAEALDPTVDEFTPADDRFHFDQMSADWWETETSWFSFCVPERRLGGWLYTMVRPNIGTVAGGAWVWDDKAYTPWQVPYSANFSALPFDGARDLDDITFPTGVRQRTIEPTSVYEVSYEDPGRLELELRFEGVMPPFGVERNGIGIGNHFDQVGRVTGQVRLHGESILVDCLAVRDRSWGRRPEDRPPHVAYVSAASRDTSFVAVTDSTRDDEPVVYGFLWQDGHASPLVLGSRSVERDPTDGWVTRIVMDLTDAEGRSIVARGVPASRIVLNRHSFIDCNSLVQWTIGDDEVWGEDQDCVPVHDWPKPCQRER